MGVSRHPVDKNQSRKSVSALFGHIFRPKMTSKMLFLLAMGLGIAASDDAIGPLREIEPGASDFILPCYFSWIGLVRGFNVESYEPGMCTHIYYGEISFDGAFNIQHHGGDIYRNNTGFYVRVNDLKLKQPGLKTVLTIGHQMPVEPGPFEFVHFFGELLISDLATRKRVAANLVRYAKRYRFDGLHINHNPEGLECQNLYTDFLKILREAAGKDFILTAALRNRYGEHDHYCGIGPEWKPNEVSEWGKILDFAHVTTFSYDGPWENRTGFNAPFWYLVPTPFGEQNTQTDMIGYANSGFPKEKLLMSIPTFAYGWHLLNASENGVFAPGTASKPKPFTKKEGVAAYYEICPQNPAHEAKETFMEMYGVPYSVDKWGDWWSHENEQSLELKMDMVKEYGFGGAFMYSLDFDDYDGACSGQKFGLTKAVRSGLDKTTTVKPSTTPPTNTSGASTSKATTAKPATTPTTLKSTTSTTTQKPTTTTVTTKTPTTTTTTQKPPTTTTTSKPSTTTTTSQPTTVTTTQKPTTTPSTQKPTTTTTSVATTPDPSASDFILPCYFTHAGLYKRRFELEAYEPGMCTHIYYGKLDISEEFAPRFNLGDLTEGTKPGFYERINKLKLKQPGLKTVMTVGGMMPIDEVNFSHHNFGGLVNDPQARKKEGARMVQWAKHNHFDGIHVNWTPDLMECNENYTAFLKELKTVGGKDFIVTAALRNSHDRALDFYCGEKPYRKKNEVAEWGKILDFAHVTTFNYAGSWENRTGFNAPLKRPLPPSTAFSVETDMADYADFCFPRNKLLLSIPTFAYGWHLLNASKNGVFAPGTASKPKPWTKSDGYAAYDEICPQKPSHKATEFWSDVCDVPYSVDKQGDWWSYESKRSIELKMQLVKQNKYGGAIIYSLDLDDYDGACSGQTFELTKAMRSGLAAVPSTTQKPKIG